MNTKIPTDLKSLKIRGELYDGRGDIWLEIVVELFADAHTINDAYIVGIREDFHMVTIDPHVWTMITEYYHFNPAGRKFLQAAAEDAVLQHQSTMQVTA